MVGVAVQRAASDVLPQQPMKKPPRLPRGAARDLYRIISALSGACERDRGVLKDGQLVDHLELQAKQILRARRQSNRSASLASSSSSVTSSRLSTSPPLGPLESSSSLTKTSKRRKLPLDYGKMDHTYGYDKSPPLSASSAVPSFDLADKASLYMSRGDGSASLIPSVKIGKIEPATHTTKSVSPFLAAQTHDVAVHSVAIPSGPSLSARDHMDHPSLDKPASSARSSRPSLDLAASMASTVSSSSMQHYDLSEDDLVSARYASAHTAYDYSHYSPVRRPSRRAGSYGEESNQSTELNDSELHVSELGSCRRKDSCYSETSTSSLGDRGTPKKLRFEVDALSLYEDEAMDAMPSSFKDVESSLVETLQSQVDLLLSENVQALSENTRLTEMSQMSACEAEAQAREKLLVAQQVKQQGEQLAELEHKFLDVQQRADAQEEIRREAEVAYQSELDSKTELVAALQKQVQHKDDEIGRLSKRVEDISGLFASKVSSVKATAPTAAVDEPEAATSLRESNVFMDMELDRMRASLLEKDREICNLYMHLSTKKKLIEEITKKFMQHMEEAAKANSNGSTDAAAAPEGVRFDLDMFLFKNVVDKQRRMEELTAALGVMDREVESLEARVAEKERENNQLRENQDFLQRSLQTVNAQVCRIQADNERLDAAVQEKQARITSLVSTLEEKERQILQFDEQVDLRETQIDHLVSGNKASSGRRSLKSSLIKARASFSSSAVKGASRSSISSENEQPRGSLSTMRSSVDWADVRRSSLVNAPRPSAATASTMPKRASVFSEVFMDISAPISDDESECGGLPDTRSTRASYAASEINEDEELLNELFARV